MPIYYADSSVLVKRHIPEKGSTWTRALTAASTGNLVVTSRISSVEVFSALNRLVRERRLSQADYTVVRDDFHGVWLRDYELVELDMSIEDRARLMLETYALRAYDAVQLSSALAVRERLRAHGGPDLIFLSADTRLLAAAQAEGFAVDNPNNYL